MTIFLFYLTVGKLNNPRPVSLNFFNGKMHIKSKSFLMLKKKETKEKEVMIPKAPVKLWFCVIK